MEVTVLYDLISEVIHITFVIPFIRSKSLFSLHSRGRDHTRCECWEVGDSGTILKAAYHRLASLLLITTTTKV